MFQKLFLGLLSLLWLIGLAPTPLRASDLFIYPTKGQSAEQQDKDKWECRAWATKETGFDPTLRATASTAPPAREAPRGGLIRGAGVGAAGGAIGGAIAGNAGKGAAIGAAAGGLLGVVRRTDQARQEQYAHQQWAQQEIGQYEQKRAGWTRAVRACLGGRGYTVE